VTALSTRTLLIAVAFGVLAVALAPLLTIGKLVRMDIPSTLRVVE
jgi:putative ABC transport system permease protein